MLRLLTLLMLWKGSWSHGFLTVPSARQPGAPGLDLSFSHHANSWYSKTAPIPVKATICDRSLLTTGMAVAGRGEVCGKADGTITKPWRAPGSVIMSSPCGNLNTRGPGGETLPPTKRTTWYAGSVVEVGAAVTNNHGGGYAYRLCPANSAITEECFQQHHLAFADNTHTVRYVNGSMLQIPARRTTSTPGARMWSRNPIPKSEDYFAAPFPGGFGDHWSFSIVDQMVIPDKLPAGNYTLGWRWDSEGVFQVWGNCADITIVSRVTDAIV